MKLILLSILFLSNNVYARGFQDINQNYQQKRYGLALRQGASLMEAAFKNILSQSYPLLPYTKNISRSNQNYSFDMQNNRIHFNSTIQYLFKYDAKTILNTSLVYAFEEVCYYNTYIQNVHITSFKNEMQAYKLNGTANGYLWNKSEAVAYYVHKFPETKNKNPEMDNIIPGLLLKIEFSKSTKYDTKVQKIVEDIVKNTKWNSLEKLYFIE